MSRYMLFVLLLLSSVVDFGCGLLVDRTRHPDFSKRRRRLVLTASIITIIERIMDSNFTASWLKHFL